MARPYSVTLPLCHSFTCPIYRGTEGVWSAKNTERRANRERWSSHCFTALVNRLQPATRMLHGVPKGHGYCFTVSTFCYPIRLETVVMESLTALNGAGGAEGKGKT